MAFQRVPDTMQCRFRMVGDNSTQLGGSDAEFSIYVRNEVPGHPDQADCDLLLQTADDWWFGAFAAACDADWVLDDIFVTSLDSEFGPAASGATHSGSHGTLAGACSPPQVCMYYRLRCDPGGAPKRGGLFLPVGTETEIDVNVWTSAFVTTVNGIMDNLNTSLESASPDWAWVVPSRFQSTNDDVKNARAALRAAIAATRRAEGVTNTLASRGGRAVLASQRDRRTGE